MDEIWERAFETALNGEKNSDSVRSLTLDGAVKCFHGRLPPPDLLEKFRNLEHLSIANIGLSSLEKFPHLPKLQRLILSDNRIAGGLEFLVEAGLDSLRDLDLSNNRIQRREDLNPLSQMKLVSLDLYECPVTKVQNYRSWVFGLIKSLKFLDKMDSDGNERPESDEEEEDEDEEEEEEDEDDEEDDPGSGEVDGESKLIKLDNGGNVDGQGVLDVDEDEESDADEEEREIEEIPNGSHQPLHSNGFRVASVGDEDDVEEEEDEVECLGEEIDEDEGEEEDVVELQEIDGSDDGDGIEDEEEEDDEDDDVDEVDEEEDVEPVSTARLTSTDGEIDGHDHEEEDGNGEIGEEEEADVEDGKSVDEDEDEDGDYGTEYLVQPLGVVDEEDVGGSDYNPGDEDVEEEEEEVDDDGDDDDVEEVQKGDLQSNPSSSAQPKRKRSEEDDADEEDDVPSMAKFKRQQ